MELAADHDQTERLADLLDGAQMCGEPAVGVDVAAQQRLWRVRESLADVLGVYGPPLKFDVSLPLSAIGGFARDAVALIRAQVGDALPLLFGHIGEGNLHLNVLRVPARAGEGAVRADDGPDRRSAAAMSAPNTASAAASGAYLGMSREAADIAAMRAVKAALDPTGYLNAAVLFD